MDDDDNDGNRTATQRERQWRQTAVCEAPALRRYTPVEVKSSQVGTSCRVSLTTSSSTTAAAISSESRRNCCSDSTARQVRLLLLLVVLQTSTTVHAVDIVRQYKNESVTSIAFGSCHDAFKLHPGDETIWKPIVQEQPDVFVWTGDAVYPPQRSVASPEVLTTLFQDMHTNRTIGYHKLHPPFGIYGTWDDHDYGGNDVGKEMPQKQARREAFWKTLLELPMKQFPPERQGLYHSVLLGPADKQVKVILLDTRWNRGRHCIPSIATNVPLGAGISAAIRWMLAGLNANAWWPLWDCWNTPVLGEEQWKWLEQELLIHNSAAVTMVVSSIQVLTTLPTMESWGHFPAERQRLLQLLGQGISGLVVLSGDVHHAELLDPMASFAYDNTSKKKHSFIEITSSGLTHDCSQPFYGALCRPLLHTYNQHRYRRHHGVVEDANTNIYIGRNYGMVQIDWEQETVQLLIKDIQGNVVLQSGPQKFAQDALTPEEIDAIVPCVDGHWIPLILKVMTALISVIVCIMAVRKGLFFVR
jgi:alkaline phosphatase D